MELNLPLLVCVNSSCGKRKCMVFFDIGFYCVHVIKINLVLHVVKWGLVLVCTRIIYPYDFTFKYTLVILFLN